MVNFFTLPFLGLVFINTISGGKTPWWLIRPKQNKQTQQNKTAVKQTKKIGHLRLGKSSIIRKICQTEIGR